MTTIREFDIRDCNSDFWRFYSDAYTQPFLRAPTYRDYEPVPKSPSWFTDRHLSSDLALCKVVLIKSLLMDIDKANREELRRFLCDNEVFPKASALPRMSWRMMDDIIKPASVRINYQYQTGIFCQGYVSKLCVHPNQGLWRSVFGLNDHLITSQFLHEGNLVILPDYGEQEFLLPVEAVKTVDPSVAAKLKILREKHETLAVFNFLPPCPESRIIMRDFGRYDVDRDWTVPRTESPVALVPRESSGQFDNPQAWWCNYSSSLVDSKQQTSESPRPKTVQRGHHLKKTVWVPPHNSRRYKGYIPEASHFLQRAWCRAVENDSTFIIFHSGDGEQIGIRHRATNTLYLSQRISPLSNGYMLLHFGMHVAIVKDALERTQLSQEPTVRQQRHDAASHKRASSNSLMPQRASKRPRKQPPVSSVILNADIEIASRHILLVSFDFGVYRSPAPSSFLRVSSSCHPRFISQSFTQPKANRFHRLSKCLNFVAKKKIGRGGTGTVYRGILELWTESGENIQETVILKLPLGTVSTEISDSEEPSYQLRMRQEYEKYLRLFKGGAGPEITKVHGVFEDVETGCIALLMQDGGTDLLQRERARLEDPKASQATLSDAEFDSLLTSVKAINRAGVMHDDLKPNNLVVDGEGRLRVIDFDRARFIRPSAYDDRDYDSEDVVTLRQIYALEWGKD